MIPDNIKWKIWNIKNRNTENGILKQEILDYYSRIPEDKKDEEIKKVLGFIQKYELVTFPYPFIYDYKIDSVKVYRDDKLDLPFVMLQDKRLYYKRNWDEQSIKENFNFLSIEQDPKSPHRYLTDTFKVKEGAVVMDIGAAEGNFGLSVIDKISKLYIFEADPDWKEALEATFAPWSAKVRIINKYVSDTNDANSVSIDEFLKDKQKADFLKIDVEGAESRILAGAHQLLTEKKGQNIAICTYHKQHDSVELAEVLKRYQFDIAYSQGYMFFLEDKQSAPYVRKGLIRAHK
ncbi:FkbM family methyltransferase [Pontibacter diazotrophicus]|nr:FkbM family methyltransferase [Pontibacter diazotrophicus]